MKRVTRIKAHPKSIPTYFPLGLAFFVGVIVTSTIFMTIARAADNAVITACVTRLAGVPRFVSDASKCTKNETVVTWNQQGQPGTGGSNAEGYFGLPFICNSCNLSKLSSKFINKDFSGALLTNVQFRNVDIHGVNFTNAELSNSFLTGSNLTGANLTNANLNGADLSSSNLSNVIFTNANLQYSTMTDAITTGAIWSNTICPDGLNSNTLGNTCAGHF